jgi:shikimate kinase
VEQDSSGAGETSRATPRTASTGRHVVLVGLMGAGKTSVGRRLAKAMGAPFVDADEEIVAAAGMSIADIFETYGEPVFRDLERRVIARLLEGPPGVLALGGGAFVDPSTRARVKEKAVSIWLDADLDTLVERTGRKRASRPLLKDGDLRAKLEALMAERRPIYAQADHRVESGSQPPETIAATILELLAEESP